MHGLLCEKLVLDNSIDSVNEHNNVGNVDFDRPAKTNVEPLSNRWSEFNNCWQLCQQVTKSTGTNYSQLFRPSNKVSCKNSRKKKSIPNKCLLPRSKDLATAAGWRHQI